MAFGLIILIILSICLLGSCNPDEEEAPVKKEYNIVDEDLTTKQTEEETVEISPESTEEETTIEETVPETMQETVVETTPETIEETIMVDTRYNLSMENLYLTESLPAEYGTGVRLARQSAIKDLSHIFHFYISRGSLYNAFISH